jgi:hypothetical protein
MKPERDHIFWIQTLFARDKHNKAAELDYKSIPNEISDLNAYILNLILYHCLNTSRIKAI